MNNANSRTVLIGITTIIAGTVWLIVNLTEIDIHLNLLWPLLVLVPGVGILVRHFFAKRQWQFLLGGTFFTLLGLFLLFNAVVTEVSGVSNIWVVTLFMYPSIAATSLWITWGASGRKIQLFIAAIIMTAISILVICFSTITALFGGVLGPENIALLNRIFWPLLTVGLGLSLMVWPLVVKLMRETKQEKQAEKTDISEENNQIDDNAEHNQNDN